MRRQRNVSQIEKKKKDQKTRNKTLTRKAQDGTWPHHAIMQQTANKAHVEIREPGSEHGLIGLEELNKH